MQHAGRNSVAASHPDHLSGTMDATNDPSFTGTATSIRLKWWRDSAKRDAKQVHSCREPCVINVIEEHHRYFITFNIKRQCTGCTRVASTLTGI